MREVKVHIYCDVCYHQTRDRIEGATTSPIDIPGYKPKTLDVCERHDKELLGGLRELLAEHGTKPTIEDLSRPKRLQLARDYQEPKASYPERERWTCPVPGCETELNRGGAIMHLYSVHTEAGDRPPQPDKCPTPECIYEAVGKPGSVMARHRLSAHNWDALNDALKAAGVAV
jgi:hypothetical protein